MGCNCFGFVDDADLSVHLARPDASRLETLSDVPDPLGTTRGDCQARLPGSATSRESKSCICVLKETSRRARRPGRRTTCVRAMVWTPAHASSSLMREANAKIQDEIRELEQASGAAVPALRTQRVRDEVLASMGLALAQVQAAGFRWDAASHLFVTGGQRGPPGPAEEDVELSPALEEWLRRVESERNRAKPALRAAEEAKRLLASPGAAPDRKAADWERMYAHVSQRSADQLREALAEAYARENECRGLRSELEGQLMALLEVPGSHLRELVRASYPAKPPGLPAPGALYAEAWAEERRARAERRRVQAELRVVLAEQHCAEKRLAEVQAAREARVAAASGAVRAWEAAYDRQTKEVVERARRMAQAAARAEVGARRASEDRASQAESRQALASSAYGRISAAVRHGASFRSREVAVGVWAWGSGRDREFCIELDVSGHRSGGVAVHVQMPLLVFEGRQKTERLGFLRARFSEAFLGQQVVVEYVPGSNPTVSVTPGVPSPGRKLPAHALASAAGAMAALCAAAVEDLSAQRPEAGAPGSVQVIGGRRANTAAARVVEAVAQWMQRAVDTSAVAAAGVALGELDVSQDHGELAAHEGDAFATPARQKVRFTVAPPEAGAWEADGATSARGKGSARASSRSGSEWGGGEGASESGWQLSPVPLRSMAHTS